MNTKEVSILLVDNIFKDIEIFIDTFKDENISIIVATTISKARSILTYIVPDLIVSELSLEDGSGYDILKLVRNHSEHDGASFLFLSKEENIKAKVKALAHGADDYFTKPYLIDELKIRIQRIIKKVSVKRFDIDKKIYSATPNLSIVEIIQLLEKTQKTGIFTIFTDHKSGIFQFKNGKIVRGQFGPATGKEAIYKIIEIKHAIYEFEFRNEDYEVDINESTQSVILDGLKLIDEAGQAEKPVEEKTSKKHEILCVGFKRSQIIHLFDEKIYNINNMENPRDAYNLLEVMSPDLLIVRPDMSEISGIDFLRSMEENPMTYQLPIVFLTTQKSKGEKITALKEGVADYISPPITKYEFDVKLKKIINEVMLKKKEHAKVLRGSLINFTVLELIQGIEGIEKTCMITFYNGDDSCILFFINGQLSNAKIKHHEGEEAVYKILMWSRGYFEIKFKDYRVPKAVKTSTFNLVLDGITKSIQEDQVEVDKIISGSDKKTRAPRSDDRKKVGLYNFLVEIGTLDFGSEFSLSTIKVGGLYKYLSHENTNNLLFIDLNMVGKDALAELLSLKKRFNEKVLNGLTIVCFTSRPEIYDTQGVLNKYSWLFNYDGTKKIMESLSDQILIKTTVDYFEFNEIKDKMYYTAAFPHGFGSPSYIPILFSTEDIPVALYKKLGKGTVFLIPQPQSKEGFMNFFINNIFVKKDKA